ncbi:MAG: hypothetical protein JXA07_02845, partial [Spirochaetes bacterium]|nr:hypothetical protein [Spirochaetota bacterium]
NCTFLSGCNASEHGGDYNLFGSSLGQYVENSHDIEASNPGFAGIPGITGPEVGDPTAEDFRIISGTPGDNNGFPGSSEIIVPDDDFFFIERGTIPDRGAVESTP